MRLKTIWNQWIENEDGNFAAMAAIASLALLLMVGFAVDTRYMTNQQQRLQSASDAIVLRAFQSGERSPAQLEAIAQEYLATLYSAEEASNISISGISRDGDEVRLVLSHSLTDSSAFFLPRNDVDVAATSSASNAGERINFALVLDTTGSMRGQKLSDLMTASNRLIDQLEAVDNDQFRVSVVPFAQHVNVGVANQNAPWLELPTNGNWNGCVGSREGNQALAPGFNASTTVADDDRMVGVTSNCGEPLLPLTRDLNAIRTKVSSLRASGFTYLPAGLMWGWRTLEASQPFTEAQATFTAGNAPRKVMLFMTDGSNTVSQIGTDHIAATQATIATVRQNANLQTAQACDAAKGSDVEIYTIALQVNNTTTRNLLEGCATSAEHSFTPESGAELVQAFEQIGRELGRLRLTG